jgi:alcohol dehydrogenase (cytochrome c)/quinohemoprotein ethanol dehydrogenase
VRKFIAAAVGVALTFITNAAMAGERPGWVTDARLRAVDAEPDNWLTVGRDYGDNRFSPLRSINDGNVARLRLAWYYDLDTHRGQEATAVAVDGVLYSTSAWSKVQAFRAATGELLWQYDPKVPGAVAAHACCDVVNRGVAVWQGRVYVGTLDGRLIALDSRTGKPVWSVLTVDPKRPYTMTGAPLVAAGKVMVGNGGAEFGVRGYITAYDARTGRRSWRFYTVPGDPSKGFENEALRRAAKTWSGKWWKDGGGGTVWNSLSYDPDLGLVYFGTGNASPWAGPVEGGGRGDGLYAASIIAVHVADGAYAWHYQTTPGDIWDYDSAETLTLATLKIDGRDRKVVMQAAKNGFFYVLDRISGELLSAKNFVPLNWAKGIDLKTGRPDVDPAAHYEATGKAWLAVPGPYGGHNWQPMSFSPLTGLVYIPAQELPFPYVKDNDFRPGAVGGNMGIDLAATSLPQDDKVKAAVLAGLKGFLSAWDPVAGRELWRVDHAGPWNGGVLSTAGNLVFQGTASGDFAAYRASDGAKLWSFPAQTGIIAAPMTFAVGGRQFVTVLAGWGGAFPLVAGELAFKSGRLPNRSRVLTFALEGTADLPPATVVTAEFPAPPTTVGAPALIAEGAKVYARYCGTCHGDAAYSGGLVPDLRYSRALADDVLWRSVVNDGALTANGMIGFEAALGAERLTAVRAYLVSRARQSYAAERAKTGATP